MDFRLSAAERALRAEIDGWLRAELGPAWTGEDVDIVDTDWVQALAFNRRLAERGWMAPAWPERFGGHGSEYPQQPPGRRPRPPAPDHRHARYGNDLGLARDVEVRPVLFRRGRHQFPVTQPERSGVRGIVARRRGPARPGRILLRWFLRPRCPRRTAPPPRHRPCSRLRPTCRHRTVSRSTRRGPSRRTPPQRPARCRASDRPPPSCPAHRCG